MKNKILLILFMLVTLSCYFTACTPGIKQFYPGTFFPEDHTYQNKSLGFNVSFKGNWELITDPNAMKENKPFAEELHSSGAELLFVGFTVEQTQGTRCIVAHLNKSTLSYAEDIRLLNINDVEKDSGLSHDTINNIPMVCWLYAKDSYNYIEYFFNIGSYNARVSFWTTPKLFTNFLPIYREIMESVSVNPK